MKRTILSATLVACAAALAACSEDTSTTPSGPQFAKNTTPGLATFRGQGFDANGDIISDRCAADADDGGTGQGIVQGEAYLLFVLSANGATSATLYIPGEAPAQMIKVGGTFKLKTGYFSVEQLDGAYATYEGNVKGSVQLVVSHGCMPFTGQGAWCSPGYWKNARAGAWALIGVDENDKWDADVMPFATSFTDASFSGFGGGPFGPSLRDVLDNASSFSGQAGHGVYAFTNSTPHTMNAFNATGAFLTSQIPGFVFDPARIGTANACPLNNAGELRSTL